MQLVFVATLAWVLSSIYLFLLTALYFIYYIEFMSLCCHDQAPQQHVLRNVASLLSLSLSFLLSCSVCAIIVKSAHKAAEWKRAGGVAVRGRVRQTSTTFAGKSFRIFKRKSLYKSKTDYKCCAIFESQLSWL